MHRRRGWPWHPTDPMTYFQSYIGDDWTFAREFLYYDAGRLVGVLDSRKFLVLGLASIRQFN